MLIHILCPVSNRPEGVNIFRSGGLNATRRLNVRLPGSTLQQLETLLIAMQGGRHTIVAREPDQAMIFSSSIDTVRWSSLHPISLNHLRFVEGAYHNEMPLMRCQPADQPR